MLTTRLWMGAVLIGLTVGMIVGDQHFPAWFPFLFVFQLGLLFLACREFIQLLRANRAPQPLVCYLGVVVFVLANWLIDHENPHVSFWLVLIGILAGFLLFA